MNEEELLTYACERFQEEKFDEALEAFVLAYCKGYEQDWILENIYQCYVEGNQEEFRKAYKFWQLEDMAAFEECLLDFIPYRDGEYYIFDKEQKRFCGVFSVPELDSTKSDKLFDEMEFSAAVAAFDWNWNEQKTVLTEAKNRKIYIVAHDIKHCLAFCKLPELMEYRDNIFFFSTAKEFQEYFHQNTAEYLPQLVFGSEVDTEELTRILDLEHEYRLTPEGRNTENILLTIAIPTHGRGNLLLKRLENLRSMRYDAEIEVTISKNGTEQYEEEYKEAGQMIDARMTYYDHGRELKYYENWRYAAGMAHGKYVLFVSDEDDVVWQALEHYLKLLTDHPELSILRGRSTYQNALITKQYYCKKGLEAFDRSFLIQNYLSGLIYRRQDFIDEHLERLDCFAENAFYVSYPHEWWCSLLNQRGDYMEDPEVLILEGEVTTEPIDFSEQEKDEKQGNLPICATYATYESRLNQFRGMVDFLHWMMDGKPQFAEVGMFWAIRKIEHLFMLARGYQYDKVHFEDWVQEFCARAMEAIDGFHFNEQNAVRLMVELKNTCDLMLQKHEKLSTEEIGE